MAIPFFKEMRHRRLSAQAEAAGQQALSAGADAGAVVPLQSRLRRLRQDRLSGRDPQPPPVGAGMPRRGRRVRRADGGDPRRRAADPQEIGEIVTGIVARKKFVSLCTNALLLEKKLAPVQAVALSVLLGPSRRPQGASRQVGVAGRRLRARGLGDQGRQGQGLRRQRQCHDLRRPSRRGHRRVPRLLQGTRRRRLDLAGLRL